MENSYQMRDATQNVAASHKYAGLCSLLKRIASHWTTPYILSPNRWKRAANGAILQRKMVPLIHTRQPAKRFPFNQILQSPDRACPMPPGVNSAPAAQRATDPKHPEDLPSRARWLRLTSPPRDCHGPPERLRLPPQPRLRAPKAE